MTSQAQQRKDFFSMVHPLRFVLPTRPRSANRPTGRLTRITGRVNALHQGERIVDLVDATPEQQALAAFGSRPSTRCKSR